MILNVYGGYDIRYIFNFTHRRLLSLFHIFIGLERHVRFDSQFTLACIMRYLPHRYQGDVQVVGTDVPMKGDKFVSVGMLACGLRFLVSLYEQFEECCN